MHTELANALTVTEGKSQYDYYAKRLLANKWVLSHIFIKTIPDFRGMTPAKVFACIEGDPIIGVVPTDPGLINAVQTKDRIVGLNSENAELNEGMIRFDIICYVRLPDGLSKIIVNVEAQKSEPTEYNILNRAIFYGCRLISSQKERDFTNSKYNDIKRVFSVWICMNMDECVLNYIHLTNEQWIGDYEWKGNLDLLNLIFIGLPKELPAQDSPYDLHRLLTALLSMAIPLNEKQTIIGSEYQIPLEKNFREDVNMMCNLSEGIFENGVEQGKELGKELGMEQKENALIISMYENGLSVEQIAPITKRTPDYIQKILSENKVGGA